MHFYKKFALNWLEFDSRVANQYPPIKDSMPGVGVVVPRLGFLPELPDRPEPPPFDALVVYGAQLVFGDVQPASMFSGVAKFQALVDPAGPLGNRGAPSLR